MDLIEYHIIGNDYFLANLLLSTSPYDPHACGFAGIGKVCVGTVGVFSGASFYLNSVKSFFIVKNLHLPCN